MLDTNAENVVRATSDLDVAARALDIALASLRDIEQRISSIATRRNDMAARRADGDYLDSDAPEILLMQLDGLELDRLRKSADTDVATARANFNVANIKASQANLNADAAIAGFNGVAIGAHTKELLRIATEAAARQAPFVGDMAVGGTEVHDQISGDLVERLDTIQSLFMLTLTEMQVMMQKSGARSRFKWSPRQEFHQAVSKLHANGGIIV